MTGNIENENTNGNISPDGRWIWNGTEWAPRPGQPEPKKKSYKVLWIVLGVIGALFVIGALTGSPEDSTADPAPAASSEAEATPEPEATSEEPTPEQTTEEAEPVITTPKKSAHESLSDREFAKLVKDPDAHAGDLVIVYAGVTQFDAATGTDTFRAGVTPSRESDPDYYWIDGENSFFVGDEADLEDVVSDDEVKVWAMVAGSYSYDTTAGGSTTVPLFTVNHIDVIGSTE